MNTVTKARILYPVWIILGMFSLMYIPSLLIETSDPIQSAQNISKHLFLFRIGIVGRLVTQLLYIFIPCLLYQIFRQQNSFMAVLMLVLALVSIPISIIAESLNLYITDCLDAPETVGHLLQLYTYLMILPTIFWGLWLFPLGALVYNSNNFPKLIGICLYIGGFGYLMGALAKILFPDITTLNNLFEVLMLGEMVFILWFIIKGISKSEV